jgi:predicted HTH domain antitoxin
MITVSSRIDKELAKEIEEIVREKGIDRSAVIRELLYIGLREYKLRKALELVRERKVTVWKAAEIAGLTYREMLEKLKEHNVPFPITAEDLARELEGCE